MTIRFAALLPFLFAALLASFATAQKEVEIRYVIPEKFERETKADDKGLLQWVEYKTPKCQTCSGTGKTTCSTCQRFPDEAKICVECKRNKDLTTACRSCAGLGEWPDPLEKVHCPQCMAAGFVLCLLCSGGGQIKTEGGGDRFGTCPMCRGEGGWKCATCNGARLVDAVPLKPSLKEANAATLAKAIAQADKALAAFAAVTPNGKDTRKEVKELVKIYTQAGSTFPALKKTPKALEEVIGKVYGGNQYQGQGEREATTLHTFKAQTEYYLKHQKRMMELALKRAEANEKLLAGQKAK